MQINRLRLIGFKSFVEPTDLLIEQGLTGVVGPNGCGKSNLLEALRWVMGETSYKSMRASTMDDVIFSGTDGRPERNAAEVMITLDNSGRTAPAEFNDNDTIEITRRIEREAGSIYRVNGKEVRARDVKVLFEDAATGARSHALVRQGQIGEIVTAKPEKRRRILEDAAGIAGLHTRRHEAEIKLRAADGNLGRMEDLLGQLNGQMSGLKRQARQAIRYKEISKEIQQTEAIVLHLGWLDVQKNVADVEEELGAIVRELATATKTEAEATRLQIDATEALQPLRDREAERAAALQRLKIENENLTQERERVASRAEELAARIAQLSNDISRETEAASEATSEKARLEAEQAGLTRNSGDEDTARTAATTALSAANDALAQHEAALGNATRQSAELAAERRRIESQMQDGQRRQVRLEEEKTSVADRLAAMSSDSPELAQLPALAEEIEELSGALEDLSDRAVGAETFAVARAGDERTATTKQNEDRIALKNLEAERDALQRLVGTKAKDRKSSPVVDQITVRKGYEKALAAALGEELDAPVADPDAEAYWRAEVSDVAGPELPADATPLSHFVTGPSALQRRLSQIGIVDADAGDALQDILSSGQRLVSREGGLWRWDGFVVRPGAETAAAKRLAMRNRIKALIEEIEITEQQSDLSTRLAEKAVKAAETARADEKKLRDELRLRQSELTAKRTVQTELERASQKTREQIAALEASATRTASELTDVTGLLAGVTAAFGDLADESALDVQIAELTETVAEARETAVTCRTTVSRLETEEKERAEKLRRIADDLERWGRRTESADRQVADLRKRLEETTAESDKLADLPDAIEKRHADLQDAIARAETARKDAADRLALTDTECRECDSQLKDAQRAVAGFRENRARSEARLEAAREKMSDHSRVIRETLDCTPEKCLERAGAVVTETMPGLNELERRLTKLKGDRERLGGVNLRAEEELEQLTSQFDTMETERVDLEESIAALRQGISKLNREARKRLLDAFDNVNAHFQRLFTTLFAGGHAELKLVDSDDPLEAGLEIVARPPGKKPATLSLLSGGEQALTATALTFAVFLTNPSPICVLDEVDAPLDDANVDRYCDLMDEMSRSTDTRFLVITHHPNTMARMRRLFGVTMMEKGVSQLVSVDLATAEKIRDIA